MITSRLFFLSWRPDMTDTDWFSLQCTDLTMKRWNWCDSSFYNLVAIVLFSGWSWGRAARDTWEGSGESGREIQEKLRDVSARGYRSQETRAEPDGVRPAWCLDDERNVCAMRKLPNPIQSFISCLHLSTYSYQFSVWQIKQSSSDPVNALLVSMMKKGLSEI